jgi:exopolysaccharide production protein ExoQ
MVSNIIRAEKLFSIIALLCFSDALFLVLIEQGATWVKPLQILVPNLIQIITLILIYIYRRRIFSLIIQEKLLWILVAIAVCSIFWAYAPGSALKRIIILIRMTSFAVYFAGRYDLKEQLKLLAYACGLAAFLSAIFALFLPHYGIMGMGSFIDEQNRVHKGAWRGIYEHKNFLGRMMVVSTMALLLATINSKKRDWFLLSALGLTIMLILLSTSKTSLVIMATILTLIPFYRALRWSYSSALPFYIIAILFSGCLATFFASNAEVILGAMGRDLTLTGRTDIWALVMEKIQTRPWLGYGLGSFWLGMQGESADIWIEMNWQAPHAHNGFLDLTLDLGLIGLISFSLTFLAACIRAMQVAHSVKTAEGLLPLTYLTFMLMVNLTESSIVRLSTIWVMFVVVVLSTHRRYPHSLYPPSMTVTVSNLPPKKQLSAHCTHN